jgi:hypothetical protein
MTANKMIPVFLVVLTLLIVSGCSSSVGGGSARPNQVNVVVPPNRDVVAPPNSTVVVPPNSTIISP